VDDPVEGEPLPGDRRYHLSKPTAVIIPSLVKPEGLPIEISTEVSGIDADVGPFECPSRGTAVKAKSKCFEIRPSLAAGQSGGPMGRIKPSSRA